MKLLRAPVSGTGWEGPQSVVYLDEESTAALWTALRDDTVEADAREHSGYAVTR